LEKQLFESKKAQIETDYYTLIAKKQSLDKEKVQLIKEREELD